jgi:hypothetical protein
MEKITTIGVKGLGLEQTTRAHCPSRNLTVEFDGTGFDIRPIGSTLWLDTTTSPMRVRDNPQSNFYVHAKVIPSTKVRKGRP